jgi:hypothetical protein
VRSSRQAAPGGLVRDDQRVDRKSGDTVDSWLIGVLNALVGPDKDAR